MIQRDFWLDKIEESWKKSPIVWLTGVRRVGKTTLASQLSDTVYLNCDLPSVAEQLKDIERFYKSVRKERIVFDEVHQLPDPSKILKIGADGFSHLKILATGSSTLAATQKFRDSLAGRKRVVHVLTVLISELEQFGINDVGSRLLRGGLPQNLLSSEHDLEPYGEWMDSFYARDVQELFRVEKRTGFLKLLELLLRQSGNLIEVSNLAKLSQLSRPTVMNYLEVLQITHAITLLRPFSGGGRREIIAQPKVYGFDTGFVAYSRAWTELRPADFGLLWEQLVFEQLRAFIDEKRIFFWRDKQQREVDFVIPAGRSTVHVIECKWNSDAFETRGIKAFRDNYASGRNYVISPQSTEPFTRRVDNLEVTFASALDLRSLI